VEEAVIEGDVADGTDVRVDQRLDSARLLLNVGEKGLRLLPRRPHDAETHHVTTCSVVRLEDIEENAAVELAAYHESAIASPFCHRCSSLPSPVELLLGYVG
jgi:hypothetical protein